MGADDPNQQFEGTKRRKPFKLCFAQKNLIGKSNVHIGKPLKLPNLITPKFYCVDKISSHSTDRDLRKFVEYLNVKGPNEIYQHPLTENQRYGWYCEVQLTDLDRSDRRLHHAKQTNPIVKEHLMNYANIR